MSIILKAYIFLLIEMHCHTISENNEPSAILCIKPPFTMNSLGNYKFGEMSIFWTRIKTP